MINVKPKKPKTTCECKVRDVRVGTDTYGKAVYWCPNCGGMKRWTGVTKHRPVYAWTIPAKLRLVVCFRVASDLLDGCEIMG